MMRVWRSVGTVMFGTALCLGACAKDPAGSAASDVCAHDIRVTDRPLTQRAKAMFITARVNGGDAVLQVDTGAYANLLTVAAARRLGMKILNAQAGFADGFGGSHRIGVAAGESIDIGAAHGGRHDFDVIDDPDKFVDSDGLLGMDLLGNFDIDLDLWGNRLGLFVPVAGCSEPVAALSPPLYAAPLVDRRIDYRPIVDVVINGETMHALIDSGAARSVIFRRDAERAGLLAAAPQAAAVKIVGIGPRVVTGAMVRSPPMVIGGLTFERFPLVIADELRLGDTGVVLGWDFINLVHVWISHSSHTLIMQYPPRATP